MRKVLIAVFIMGCFYSLFATDARVLTMGRTDAFFMDDISVFRNPANVGIYPNMLIGDLGVYVEDTALDSQGETAALKPNNRDPLRPYFGGIFSYSLNQSADAGDQYPMLSLGVVLNRYDDLLDYVTPGSKKYFGVDLNPAVIDQTPSFEDPVGKIDVLLGVALKNGGMIGLGAYTAFQKKRVNDVDKEEMKVIKGNIGINLPVAKTMDLEVSFNGAVLTQIGRVDTNAAGTSDSLVKVADNDIAISADIRLFSALSSLNGDFVPHLEVDFIKFHSNEHHIYSFDGGVGININIDRGFFWSGIEVFYEENSYRYDTDKGEFSAGGTDTFGGRVSFDIERNIIWDFFVMRLGATKKLAFQKDGGTNGTTKWIENPEADASDEDHVAFGVALNIENRFKIDAIMAEDIFYTFSNLFSGNHHHIFTRFSATYSF